MTNVHMEEETPATPINPTDEPQEEVPEIEPEVEPVTPPVKE